MDISTLLLFALFGMVVGAYGTLIGAGGGFIIVPVLLLLLHWPHQEASGTSLLVVTANAASGTWAYWRQRRIDFRTGWQFALATLPGAILGPFIVEQIDRHRLATRGGDGKEAPLGVQGRRAIVLVFAELAGVPLPCDLE